MVKSTENTQTFDMIIGGKKQELQRLSKDKPTIKKELLESKTLYIFLSIDLTNSTAFKAKAPDLWADVVPEFYKAVKNKYLDLSLWKLVGDEVLLYTPLFNIDLIANLIKQTDRVVKNLIDEIADNIGYKKGKVKEGKAIIKNSLGAKGTMWISLCGTGQRNRVFPSPFSVDVTAPALDFIGRDIDEGFRISKFAVKDRVIISPLLAGVISSFKTQMHSTQTVSEAGSSINDIRNDNFIITSYQKLKGLWNDRFVPIIMFFGDGSEGLNKFEYDELMHESFCPSFTGLPTQYVAEEKNRLSNVRKILKSVSLDKECRSIVTLLEDSHYQDRAENIKQRLCTSIGAL